MMIRRSAKANSRNLRAHPEAISGFALVELLVVVALITVLVGIIVPVTVQSRNRARSAACVSNLRQLGFALLAYGQDWNDRLPSLSSKPFAGSLSSDQYPGGSSATELSFVISRYAKSRGIYRCGNDIGAPEYGYRSSEGSVFSHTGSSYLPWSAARTGTYGVALNGTRASSLAPVSGYCLLRDYGSDWHGYRTRNGIDVEATTVANAAYADGHVAAVPVLSIQVSDRGYACYASERTDTIFISGGSGEVQAELSGRHRIDAGEGLRLCLSGTVSSGGVSNNVDHVFSFGAETKMDAALRQVVAWIDGLAAR
jgi:prepilin-type processing-associated H-X9-DG protein